MTSQSELSIATRNLNLWYGSFQALIDVSINIKHRLITSLIGPSGCGKSTLLRCFNRVNERWGYVRTTGEIAVLGQNIYAPEVSLVELRKSVGMVFQRPNPLPISVYENVVFGIRVHCRADQPAAAAARRGRREGAHGSGPLEGPERQASRQGN
jgi:phosphate transport system ATP-binding protein